MSIPGADTRKPILYFIFLFALLFVKASVADIEVAEFSFPVDQDTFLVDLGHEPTIVSAVKFSVSGTSRPGGMDCKYCDEIYDPYCEDPLIATYSCGMLLRVSMIEDGEVGLGAVSLQLGEGDFTVSDMYICSWECQHGYFLDGKEKFVINTQLDAMDCMFQCDGNISTFYDGEMSLSGDILIKVFYQDLTPVESVLWEGLKSRYR